MKIINYLINKLFRNVKVNGKNHITNINLWNKNPKIRIFGEGNYFQLSEGFDFKKSRIHIEGIGNTVILGKNFTGKNLKLEVKGNNQKVVIGDDVKVYERLEIHNDTFGNDTYLEIGDFTTFAGTDIHLYDKGSSIKIGKDCMFSTDVVIYHTDGHCIFQNEKLINQANELVIGDHCWFGWSSTILKNSIIPNNTIVARSSLVSGKFKEDNTVLAGIPAKVIKEGINWDRRSVNEYLAERDKK